tara:strand:- start:666 stop:1343 length:678 start_codon:yes stop_codon:yes gene_type:complete
LEPNPKKLFQLALCVLFLFALLFIGYLSFVAIAGEEGKLLIESGWVSFEKFVLQNGFWLFCSIAILPGFILPVAPLLTLAGYWGDEHGPWLACLNCALALAINLCWTYWFARKPGRSLIEKILSKTKYQLPEKPSENLMQWALILRLTPGVPFIFTNYGLALLKMPFLAYLIVSIPVLAFTGCGYVLAFAGIFGGNWAYLYGGASMIVVMFLLGRLFLKRKKHAD